MRVRRKSYNEEFLHHIAKLGHPQMDNFIKLDFLESCDSACWEGTAPGFRTTAQFCSKACRRAFREMRAETIIAIEAVLVSMEKSAAADELDSSNLQDVEIGEN